jgi:tRNA A-37 threonylcarbamoyl transferase component Bud32/tetratricopeptide (TPR) repeat protein/TolB-like protein
MTSIADRLSAALVGRYRVERELGAGGMATVYLADDLRHQRRVAIKVLRQDLAAALGAERFHREIRIAAGLQHPHIVPLYDSGEADGLLFYVMPYVSGMSVREKLRKERELPVNDAARILRDVADALAAAHEHGVVHRDLKPENVMLSGRHALVTDFGVAKAVSEASGNQTLTAIGLTLGTPAYMAPEQVTADANLDHRADIYAFGVLAYELLTGDPPFTGLSAQEVLAAHVTAQPVGVSTHRGAIPAPLALLIMRCLEKKPADRWQRADELVGQLEAILTHDGAATPKPRLPAHKLRRRGRMLVAAGLATMAVVLAVAVNKLGSEDLPLDANRVLVAPFAIQESVPDASALATRLESSIVEGLRRADLGVITDSRTALAEASFDDTSATALAEIRVALQLARSVQAGFTIVGRILPMGDSVQVEAKLLDTGTGAEAIPIPRQKGALGAVAFLVDVVAQRIMGGLAIHRDPLWGAAFPGASAITYAAYRSFKEGDRHFLRSEFQQAGERYRQAYEMDTTFVFAAIHYGTRMYNAGNHAVVDSLGVALDSRRSTMSRFEIQYLNRLLAWNRGDMNAFYTSSRELARIAPQSILARNFAARAGLFVNRVAESYKELQAIDPSEYSFPGIQPGIFLDLTSAAHKLGDHEAELDWVHRWSAHPQNERPLTTRQLEARALVGLKQVSKVSEILPQLLTMRADGNLGPAGAALAIIAELRWHGHDTAAARLSQLALQRTASTLSGVQLLQYLIFAGDLDAAAAAGDSLLRVTPEDRDVLHWTGAVAAARKEYTRARELMRQLEQRVRPYDNGRTSLRLAQILALMGERELAVQMLDRAFNEGSGNGFTGYTFHAQYGLEPLRGYAPFEAFVKPKE